MARRKKGKETEPTESKPEEGAGAPETEAAPLDSEPTQVDAKIPEAEPAAPEDTGAEVGSPLSGDTEKLYTDEPPVPPDQELASVTDIDSAREPAPEEGGENGAEAAVDPGRLEAIVESLLFASDKPLGLAELKRLLGERDGKKITAAVEALAEKRQGSGILVTSAAGGWQLRTNPEHAPWVGKLLAGRPMRLSRAMLETMSIVAYRQPVTRPEIDDIRGVDCGPVLKTLLDRGLIRIIGKKEEVGRPMLYGTTPEFLRVFNLRDLAELPTLREFHELGAEEKAKVDAEHGVAAGAPEAGVSDLAAAAASVFTPHPPLAPDPEEDDGLIEDLERAAQAAARASGAAEEPPAPPPERSS
ncbi:MAG TPA: SMC-Scp complex subunit ScpB [Polyangia bacterium]|nr:SMC-Scp complex subunit ScpB [Polyangia bacterium]